MSDAKKRIAFTVEFKPADFARLRTFAASEKSSAGRIVRLALDQYLDAHNAPPAPPETQPTGIPTKGEAE